MDLGFQRESWTILSGQGYASPSLGRVGPLLGCWTGSDFLTSETPGCVWGRRGLYGRRARCGLKTSASEWPALSQPPPHPGLCTLVLVSLISCTFVASGGSPTVASLDQRHSQVLKTIEGVGMEDSLVGVTVKKDLLILKPCLR